jgi:hypothetical protein
MDNKEEKILEKIKMLKDQKNPNQTLHNLGKDIKKEIMAINQENTIILESIIIQEEANSTITIEDSMVVIDQDNMVAIEDNMVVIEDNLGNMIIEDSITADKETKIEDKKRMIEVLIEEIVESKEKVNKMSIIDLN